MVIATLQMILLSPLYGDMAHNGLRPPNGSITVQSEQSESQGNDIQPSVD